MDSSSWPSKEKLITLWFDKWKLPGSLQVLELDWENLEDSRGKTRGR